MADGGWWNNILEKLLNFQFQKIESCGHIMTDLNFGKNYEFSVKDDVKWRIEILKKLLNFQFWKIQNRACRMAD